MKFPAWRNKYGWLPVRVLRKLISTLGAILYRVTCRMPGFGFLKAYEGKPGAISLRTWFFQRILGFNRHAYWGVHFTSRVGNFRAIEVGKHTNPGIEPGCYIQGIGLIRIGDYTNIAMNCAIISSNHDVYDGRQHLPGSARIGSYCWIGANCTILPGVVLGDFTVVGAGSVVTKSFPDGYCVIAGNPAKKLRDLEADRCVRYDYSNEYIGYMPAEKFPAFRLNYLYSEIEKQ